MVLLIGIILLALGISLAVAWSHAFLIALQGLVAIGCLLVGIIFLLVGYSEMKARREYNTAVSESTGKTARAGDESPETIANTPLSS